MTAAGPVGLAVASRDAYNRELDTQGSCNSIVLLNPDLIAG